MGSGFGSSRDLLSTMPMRFEWRKQLARALDVVPRRLALLDEQNRRVHVGRKRQRVRAGEDRRHVEDDQSVAIAAAQLANHVRHHRRAHQLGCVRDRRAAGKHDEIADIGVDQQVLERRVAHQVVREAGPRLELQHVAQVRIAEVGVDQQRRVVHLHREADGEVERDGGLAGALVGARHRERLPAVLAHLHQDLRAQQPECVGRRVVRSPRPRGGAPALAGQSRRRGCACT